MSRQQSGLPGIYNNTFPAAYEQYNTQYGGQIEAIGWKWWDTQTFTSAATVQLTNFFNVRATPDLSNMEVAFQLAAPKAFLVRAIQMFYKVRPRAVTPATVNGNPATGTFDDVAQLINTGTMNLTIGQKLYDMEPTWVLTAGGGAMGFFALAGDVEATASYAQNGVPDPRAVNTLSVPIFIPPQMNFTAVITWPTALTLAGGDTGIQLLLDGDLVRPVQ